MDSAEQVRREIAKLVSSPLEALAIVNTLAGTDWGAYLKDLPAILQEENAQAYSNRKRWFLSIGGELEPCDRCKESFIPTDIRTSEYKGYPGSYCLECRLAIADEEREKPRPCGRCGDLLHWSQLQDVNEIRGHHREYCAPCVEAVKQEYSRVCSVCPTNFYANASSDQITLCNECRTPRNVDEYQRVKEHNKRAQSASTLADLTLTQWLATLNHFQWRCAYCSGPFMGMEHYLPISLEGGTTRSNCVPSCGSCNMRKSNRHPNEIDGLFSVERLMDIREWLKQDENKHADTLASLFGFEE